jgi:nucleoporin SEH1
MPPLDAGELMPTPSQVKWNTPLMGNVIASIGEDGRFRLWEEDVTETPNSGRRFVQIHSQISETKVPYQSLDIKNIDTETYIALITRDGYLTVTAPVDSTDLRNSEWAPLTQEFVCPTPSASEETGFRVAFHKDPFPCPSAVLAGLDRRCLSLAVAAMNTVKVYRTDIQRRFYVAATLTGARDIIRDVAWANGSARGYDRIAAASKDGAIRIYKLTVPIVETSTASPVTTARSSADTKPGQDHHHSSRHPPSGIGAGLATTRPMDASRANNDDYHPGRVKHKVEQVAEISKHGNATWRLSFDYGGMFEDIDRSMACRLITHSHQVAFF